MDNKPKQPSIPPASVRSTSIRNPYSRLLDEPKLKVDEDESKNVSSSHKSLPRNFSSASNSNSWTLLDTEMAKEKGIQFVFLHMLEIAKWV